VTRLSLRARVAAGAAAVIVLVVIVLGVAVAYLVENDLRGALDRDLRDRAVGVERLAATTPALLTAPGALAAPSGGIDAEIEVFNRRGAVIAASPALAGRHLPDPGLVAGAIRQGSAGYATADFGGGPVRLYAAPVADVGGSAAGGAVLVGASLSGVRDTVGRVRSVIAVSALAAAVIGGLLVAFVAGRGLRPLRRLTDAAASVGSGGDAAARLPEVGGPREVSELTRTLNGMLAALAHARDTERRFLADASHQLRTPLTALRGNAAYLARHGADPDVLADIETDAARVGMLVDDLLALERAEAADPPRERVDLAAIAAEEARRAGATVERLDPAVVRGDPVALRGALANLLDNARLHGPEGGPVTVRLAAADGRVVLSVRDAGPGVPPDQADSAFARFWRGPDTAGRPGSGLGLAIVRATAVGHGGTARVDGSTFAIELPLAADAPPAANA
jgi:two-component system, OmpR family, sensor kinase